MKKIIFLLMLFTLGALVSNAQTRPVTADTVIGAETVYFAPSYNYVFDGKYDYSGVVGFQYGVQNIQDSLKTFALEGSLDGISYVNVSSVTETNSEGTKAIFDTSPTFVKYRLSASCIASDTVYIYNITYIEKD